MANEQFLYNLSSRYASTGAFQQFEKEAERAGNKASDAMHRAERSVDGVDRKLRAAAAGLAVFQGPLGGLASRVNATAQVFQFMSNGAATAVASIGALGAVLNSASGVQQYQAKLVAATKTQAEFVAAQQLAVLTARGSRAELGDTIQFYVRLASATNGLGISQRELFTVIGTVQKAIQLSGAGAQEATAAMQQFSQAIGSASGLSGDEFKSLGENANKVLQVLAEGLVKTNAIPGFDGSIGALRKLGAEGQLTRDKLLPALQAMQGGVDDLFGRMPVTIQQATNQLTTSLTQVVIKTEETFGPLRGAATVIGLVADNMDVLGGVAVVAGTAIATRFVGGLVAANAAALVTGARMVALTLGFNGVVPAMLAQGIAANRLSIALKALATPTNVIGAALTITAGALYFFSTRATEAEKAAKLLGISEGELAGEVQRLTGYITGQNEALAKNIDLKTRRGQVEAQERLGQAGSDDSVQRRRLSGALRTAASSSSAGANAFVQLASAVEGGLDPRSLQERLDVLERKFPKTFQSLGKNIYAAADDVAASSAALLKVRKDLIDGIDKQDGLAALQAREAEKKASLRSVVSLGIDGKARGNGAKTKAQLDAEASASAIDAGTQTIAAASSRRRKAIADLEASFGNIGKATAEQQTEYAKQRAAIEERYNAEVESVKQAAAAKKASAAQDRLDAAARRAAAREDARDIETLNRIRERYEKKVNPNAQAESDKLTVIGLARKDSSINVGAEFERINAAIRQPLVEANAAAKELATTQGLILAGREADAEVLQRANALIRAGLDASLIDLSLIGQQVESERRRNREIELRGQLIDIQARSVGEIQTAFTNLFASGNLGQFGSSLKNTFKQAFAQELSLKIFGNAEQEARDRATGAINVNTDAMGDLRSAMLDLQNALQGNTSIGGGALLSPADAVSDGIKSVLSSPLVRAPANDNVATIAGRSGSATAILAKESAGLSADIRRFSTNVVRSVQSGPVGQTSRNTEERFNETFRDFGAKLDKTFGSGGTFEKLGGFAGTALKGAATGDFINGIIGGNKGSKIGGQIGGALGAATGIPGGEIIGAVLGNIVGGLFKKDPYGDARATVGANGKVSFSNQKVRGDGSSDNLANLTNALAATFDALTSQLGATLTKGATLGGVGFNKDQYYFSPTTSSFKASDKQVFSTAEEAVFASLKNAIDKGIVTGVRAGTKNLLLASKDLEFQLSKAVKFEAVFTDLRRATDPVGAAVDELNKKFTELRDIFAEAGASAEEYSQLQQLYDLQRADALKTAGNAQLETLRSYLTELTTSSGSGLSARDRRESALAAFTPFANDIAAGKKVDVDAYRTAAENLREVERELYGSTQGYFDRLSQITDLTRQAISGQTNVTSIADALNFNAPAQVTPITNGLLSLENAFVAGQDRANELLEQIRIGLGGGQADFVDTYAIRGF